MTTLTPGTYRLTRDVQNPKPNGRKYRWWSAADVVPAGSVLSVEPHPIGKEDDLLQLRCHGFPSHGDSALEDSELFAALVPHLEAVRESPSALLFRKEWSLMGPEILDQLCLAGLITTEQVEAAAHTASEAARKAYAAEQQTGNK